MKQTLTDLEDKKINSYTISIGKKTEGRFPEETNFKLYLKNREGKVTEAPVLWGKYFRGRGKTYGPWFEIDFKRKIGFDSHSTELSNEELKKLFKRIIDLLPPGGRIMVVYAEHKETEDALQKNIPSPATPIGSLLFWAGCVWFKDWYFPEGGREGNVKLQGEKPINEDSKKEGLSKIKKELERFLEREKSRKSSIFAKSKKRAKEILKEVDKSLETS